MSQEDTQRVARAWFDALDRGDIPAAVTLLDDHIEWQNLSPVKGISDVVPWFVRAATASRKWPRRSACAMPWSVSRSLNP